MRRPDESKVTVLTLKELKDKGIKITAVTAYDFPSAQIASEAGIDLILVGDSLGMVFQGHANTLPVTIDDTVYHTAHVARANPRCLVVSDLPFGSYHISPERTVENAVRCVKEGGAAAVKLEGGSKRLPAIEAILNAEVPVMGHLGLTPQSIHSLGGFKVQGKLRETAREIFTDALALEKAGVFAMVLESIPQELGRKISEAVKVPTIGIGAGKYCDGQILVLPDLVGLTHLAMPKFVRQYADTYGTWLASLRRYSQDVRSGDFPADSECYHWQRDIDEVLK